MATENHTDKNVVFRKLKAKSENKVCLHLLVMGSLQSNADNAELGFPKGRKGKGKDGSGGRVGNDGRFGYGQGNQYGGR